LRGYSVFFVNFEPHKGDSKQMRSAAIWFQGVVSPLQARSHDDSAHRSNARKLQQAIVETNGLAKAADLVEQSLGLTRTSQKQ
jgi:hypothetical protein